MSRRDWAGRCGRIATRLVRLALGLALWTCRAGPSGTAAEAAPPGLRAEPLAAGLEEPSQHLFESLPATRTGLDFVHRWNPAPKYERLLNSSAVGAGVAAGDYDGDGLPDLCLTRPSGGCALYRNLGRFRFTNVTERAGLRTEAAWTTGVTFADVNNDGRLDLYVCCYDSPNLLYVNQGDGTFVEQARAYGLDFNGASIMMAFGDYDRDGRLDAYLLTGGLVPGPAQRFRVKFVNNRPVVPEELQEYWQLIYQPGDRAAAAEAGQFDRLFHNDGRGAFTDVSRAAGISGCDFGNAVLWWDYDGDGWPDLYVANDYFGPDRLYRNNHDGTFADVTRASLPHTPWTSMGADAADIDNDGLMDLLATDMSGTTHRKRMVDLGDTEKSGWFLDLPEPRQYMRNALYLNTGAGRFLEIASLLGIADTDWTWSALFGDLDNDGWVDLFVANGMTRDWMDNDLAARTKGMSPAEYARFWQTQPVRADLNLAFRNLGNLTFQNVAREWGLDHPGPGFGAVLADLDGDGRLDLVVNDFQAPARLYRNCESGHRRVKVRLLGRQNRFGIGATIRLEGSAGVQTRYLTLAHGFMSAGEPMAYFGLGADTTVRRLSVEWPGGQTQAFENLAVDRFYTIEEPADATPAPARLSPPLPFFVPSQRVAGTGHEAEPSDDLSRQPLLPWDLSHFGPGLAWADVDGDGVEEFYLAGNPARPGGLYRRTAAGGSQRDPQSGLTSTGNEMAPLFFDANADGFPDLLVAPGGLGGAAGDDRYLLRLYLNDGHGRFAPAPPGTLPDLRLSGSAAVAADFDRDGDLDVFVGGRLIPGKYPSAPPSYLLRNESGHFKDVTEELAPALRQAGLVTGALWSDFDDDGWVDLLVTTEWGPVRCFHNEHGRLFERTREAGLERLLGWWNGIAAGDFNHDGRIDYVVSNLGLNTRYQPSEAQPCRLYWGDFAGTGEPQLIEALLTPEGLLPRRGKTALERAVPRLAEAFPTHAAYAAARLPDLLGADALAAAPRLEVNTLASGVLINQGGGRFAFQPLPRLAQVAPAFGVAVADMDGDGNPDLYLAQNFYEPQRETGRMNGGVSLLLLGRGDGTFAPVRPDRSGLVVSGDARSVAVTDLDGDGRPDLVVSVNGGPLQAFENRGAATNRVLRVWLEGKPGNPTAVGARVTLHLKDGAARVAEVQAGSGYLAQSTATLFFGLGVRDEISQLAVRWPNGKTTTHPAPAPAQAVRIRQE